MESGTPTDSLQSRRALPTALLVAVLAHTLLLKFITLPKAPAVTPATHHLNVKLHRATLARESNTPTPASDKAEPRPPPGVVTVPVPETPDGKPSTTTAAPVTTGPSGFVLYQRAMDAIPAILEEETPRVRNFSLADILPVDEEPIAERRILPTLISAPFRRETVDINGMRTVLVGDGFGGYRCLQERGFPGDGNPPLWYIIPASTCSHLKR